MQFLSLAIYIAQKPDPLGWSHFLMQFYRPAIFLNGGPAVIKPLLIPANIQELADLAGTDGLCAKKQ
jgi:hypothetical protein